MFPAQAHTKDSAFCWIERLKGVGQVFSQNLQMNCSEVGSQKLT